MGRLKAENPLSSSYEDQNGAAGPGHNTNNHYLAILDHDAFFPAGS